LIIKLVDSCSSQRRIGAANRHPKQHYVRDEGFLSGC
jgi:hypothetical protein